MTTTLLKTKLFRPPLRTSLISRARIISKLNAGLDGKLTLVSAPPGFGKTTLVSEWLSQTPAGYELAWLSLEENDNDPTQFFAYLIGALQTVHPEIGQDLALASQLPPPEIAVAMLINDITAVARPVLLVLDDYHLITTTAIHQAILYLVDHMPATLHLVIISRADPPFSLSRIRVRRQLTEVRVRDLRFTTAEAGDFLHQTMGLELTPDEVALLESRTEGWVAGLQLAAHSLQLEDNKLAFLTAFAGDDRYIADYLLEEVLAHQPEAIQQFLVHTSILERLSSPLCDALLGRQDSQSILQLLEGSNLFIVPLDNRRQWFRYHRLFADLLRERLEASPEEMIALHRRASQWYAENGSLPQAVEHALSAADYARAIELFLACIPEMFMTSRLTTVLRWWQQIPEEITNHNPALSLAAAWAWLGTGQRQESEGCLLAVESALGRSTKALLTDIETLEPITRNGLIEVATIRVSRGVVLWTDLRNTLIICERMLPYLVEEDQPHLFNPPIYLRPVILFNMGLAYQALGQQKEAVVAFEESAGLGQAQGNVHIVASALAHLAEVRIVLGELHAAADTCRQGIEVVTALAGKISPMSGLLHVRLGQLFYEWNELETAVQHLQEGITVAKPWRNREALLSGYLELARAYLALGQDQDALLAQETFAEWVAEEPVATDPAAYANQAWLQAQMGDMAAASRWVKNCGLELDQEPVRELEALVLIRIKLKQGQEEGAGQWLNKLLASAEAGEQWGRVVELLLLQALIFESQDNRPEALKAISRALAMAETEGYVRTFVDGGRPVAGLLGEVARSHGATEYLDRLLIAFQANTTGGRETSRTASPTSPTPVALVEPLSDRELEVLHLIAEGLTNREIAARLFLSPGTVKAHTHNIYGKLGVSGRTLAVATARSLNILD